MLVRHENNDCLQLVPEARNEGVMMSYYKADFCKASNGEPFVYVEPTWIQPPQNADGSWVLGVRIGTCFYLRPEDADDLAEQLTIAAQNARNLTTTKE
jgi:hypothetical protein